MSQPNGHPSPEPRPEPLDAQTFLKESVAYFLLAVLSIAVTDCFGLEVGARRALQDGFNQVMVDWYEWFPYRRASDQPPPAEVAVVLWEEGDLAARERVWPLPYAEHATALRRIVA